MKVRQQRGVAGRAGGLGRAERLQRLGVTIQGLTVVAKDLPRKGPSGWYSHAWMSRADQSLSRQ
jgi:hypothetical protein